MTTYLSTNTDIGLINALTQSVNVYLPQTISGKNIYIKDAAGTSQKSTITIFTQGSDSFEDGSVRQVLNQPYGSYILSYSTNKWFTTGGTYFNTLNVSSLLTQTISSISISTASLSVSTLKFQDQALSSVGILNAISSLLYYNSNLVGGGFREAIPQIVKAQISYAAYNANFPKQFSGLSLWLDSTDSTTISFSSGSNVSQWLDKSTNAFVLSNATVAYQPIYVLNSVNNYPSLVFDGTKFLYKLAVLYSILTISSEVTVFIIHRPSNVAAGAVLTPIAWSDLGINAAIPRISLHTPNGLTLTMDYYDYTTGRISIAQTNYSTTLTRMECGFKRGTAHTLRAFGSQLGTQTNNNGISTGTVPIAVGCMYNGGVSSYQYQGNICEVVWYNRALSDTEIYKVEGYLAWKWGLVSNLPSTHPYVYAPPPP